jgi:Tfp pilus assembly protein PilZ
MSSSAKRIDPPQVEAKIKTGTKSSVASGVWNTSLGGLFLEMKEPVAFGADVELELSLPEDPRTIRCGGFVIWSTKSSPEKAPHKSGVAVRLTNIGIAEMRHLARCVGRTLPGAE